MTSDVLREQGGFLRTSARLTNVTAVTGRFIVIWVVALCRT